MHIALWETPHYIINDEAVTAEEASGCHASHLYVAEVMAGEMQFNIDTKELWGEKFIMNCRSAACLWQWFSPERHIHCSPFILLSTIKSINCHNKPLLGCVQVSANCLGLYNSLSPGGSGHRQQFLLHFTPARPEMYETISTFRLHNEAGTLSGHLHFRTIFTSKTITCHSASEVAVLHYNNYLIES